MNLISFLLISIGIASKNLAFYDDKHFLSYSAVNSSKVLGCAGSTCAACCTCMKSRLGSCAKHVEKTLLCDATFEDDGHGQPMTVHRYRAHLHETFAEATKPDDLASALEYYQLQYLSSYLDECGSKGDEGHIISKEKRAQKLHQTLVDHEERAAVKHTI
jgi:hypothetical protein